MIPDHHFDNAATQTALAAGPVAAILAWVGGMSLEQWMAFAGLLSLSLQTAYMLWRWRRDVRREAERIAARESPPETDRGELG